MKVLVIDDHPVVLQGCRRLLEDLGVSEVLTAGSLSEGFRLYRRERPSAITIDLSMQSAALGDLSFICRLRAHDEGTAGLVLSMHADPTIVRGQLLSHQPSGLTYLKDIRGTGAQGWGTSPERIQYLS